MKKTLARLAVATGLAAVLAASLMLAACGGGLSGRYIYTGDKFAAAQFNNEPLVAVEFKSFGNAEIVTSGLSTTTYEDGSYKVDGDQITLKAKWNYSDKWEGTYSFSQSSDQFGDAIYIDGHKYWAESNGGFGSGPPSP